MVKKKKPIKMKTHEIMDELYDWEDEKRGNELDEEFRSRYPFNYIFDKIEEFEERLDNLESNFLKHSHIKGKLVKTI